ncbi:ATP-binding protein [Escherichia coli]|uniref:ATP-binding protein n=1 Tax=Escherichia coli TaxID=562 RepID=UPI0010AF36C8|nr:ATP-binding protein [Escherichia coli]GCK64847.1 hypothetical protein BvCmsC29A_00194 [Escherichia coli]
MRIKHSNMINMNMNMNMMKEAINVLINLCDENFDYFDFLSAPEKTLVLNSVAIGNNLRESKVVQFIVRFIKTARKRGKRLIVVTTPSDGGVQIQNLFDTVISLTRSHDEIGCTVIIPVPELIKYE